METTEALDRELIVERAEALRSWLAGFGLSGRAAGAIERELSGIIANDPGSYINGQRPLAGLTIGDFVRELHSRNAGAVGRVKNVGDSVVKELRAAIPPDTEVAGPSVAEAAEERPAGATESAPQATETSTEVAEPAPQASSGEAEAPRRRPGRPKGSTTKARANAEGASAATPEASAAPKRRGRPKGSTRAARNGAAPTAAAPPAAQAQTPAPALAQGAAPSADGTAPDMPALAEAPKPARKRGRPRRTDAPPSPAPKPAPAPAPTRAAPAPQAVGDPALDQLVRLWPALHPHGRRAVVLYASELLAEAGFSA